MDNELSPEQKIINAAKEVFIAKGFAGARMQEIADLAGINKAMLHYYFRSKDKLFHKIFEEVIAQQMPSILSTLSSDIPFHERLALFVDQYITMLQHNPYIPMFILSELSKNSGDMMEFFMGTIKPRFSLILSRLEIELQNSNISNKDPRQFIMNILGLILYPFVAKPLLQFMFDTTPEDFDQLLEDRKKLVPELLIKLLK